MNIEQLAIRIAQCTNMGDLQKIGKMIADDQRKNLSYTHNADSMSYLRKVWKIRSYEIDSARQCSPHNKAENHVLRDGRVYCKVCNKFIGYPCPVKVEIPDDASVDEEKVGDKTMRTVLLKNREW